MTTQSSPPSAPRVVRREQIGLGLGRVAADGTHGTLHLLVNPIYNMTLGLNPALISTVVFIQRLWDGLLDPLWGQFSDNFRSRWGRRIPLLAVAAVPLAVLFAAIWWFPRGASHGYLFWHLLLVSLAFYTAHSLFAMPLGALIVEATDDYHERTRIAGTTLAFGFGFQIASNWLFHFTHSTAFGDTITGVRWIAVGCSLLFLIAALAPVTLCRERNYGRVAAHQPRTSLIAGLKAVRKDRAFFSLLGARFVASFGYNIVGMLGIYMNTYYVFGGDLKRGAWAYGFLGSAYQVTSIVMAVFVYPSLSRRWGKKRTLQVAAGTLIVGCAGKLVLYQPELPWLQLIVLATNGAAGAGLALMVSAMIGDVADRDELLHGTRREALFTALMNWFDKAGTSFGLWLAGFVLLWIGFDAKAGAQSRETLELMKYCYAAAPATGAIIALLLIRRYDLTEGRVHEIRAELERRHAAGSPPAVTSAT